jgi:hypothetical protein
MRYGVRKPRRASGGDWRASVRAVAQHIALAELSIYPQTDTACPKRHGKRLQEDVLKFLAA